MRVLIVEDSALVQKMYGLAFSQRHHVLVSAPDGRAGLAILKSEPEPFDLILLDLRMPDMNGVEFLTELQRRGINTPVILTTAEPAGSPLLEEARALQPAGLVHKPWKPAQLRDSAREVLGQEIA